MPKPDCTPPIFLSAFSRDAAHSLLLFVVLLCSPGWIAAQNNLPNVYEFTADTAKGRINLPDSCWQILPDPGGKLTIDEVNSSPVSDRFLKPDTQTTSANYSIHTYWFRYGLSLAYDIVKAHGEK